MGSIGTKESGGGQFANGWDFPGIRDRVNELEAKLNRASSQKTISTIRKSLVSLDTTITTQYNNAGPLDDTNALLTYRRRVRQLIQRIRDMEEL